MGLLGPKVALLLDSTGPYRWGDVIVGKIIVKSDRPVDVNNIDVMLRCTENVSIFISEASARKRNICELHNHNRLYSYRETLFPTHLAKRGLEPPIKWSNEQAKPTNSWASQFKTGYTLPAGTHTFDFQLQVPEGYPSSLYLNAGTNVQWVVTVKLFKGSLLTLSQDCSQDVKVYRSARLLYDATRDERISKDSRLTVYLEGYKNSKSSLSGFINNLTHLETEFKQKKDVSFYLLLPNTALMQDPHPINVSIGFESAVLDLLLLRSIRLKLKRTVFLTAYSSLSFKSSHMDYDRDSFILYQKNGLNVPLESGLKQINEEIRNVRITGFQTDSYSSRHFNIWYELAALVSIASKANPNSTHKLRISHPVMMQSCMADVTAVDHSVADPYANIVVPDTLPVYEK